MNHCRLGSGSFLFAGLGLGRQGIFLSGHFPGIYTIWRRLVIPMLVK
jgi:hypothetical protein